MDSKAFRDLLNTESIFKDASTLSQAWVPGEDEKLLCRDKEITQLVTEYRRIIESNGYYSSNVLILGKGGIGKTITTRYFLREFKKVLLENDIELVAEYIDCLQYRTKSSILRKILEKLKMGSGHGYSDSEIMEQILLELKKKEKYLFIILDEVYVMTPDDLLSLLNASISFGAQNSRFSIICICRKSDWYKIENEKINSRIQFQINMEPYTREEGFKILKYRRNLAFREGAFPDDVLELVADIVYETKNMRIGIDILRLVGNHCDEHRYSEVDAEMVLKARNEIAPSFKDEVIDYLKPHEKLTLLAIAKTLEMTKEPFCKIENAYEIYQMICEEYGVKPHVVMSFRKYVRKLDSLKLIVKEYMNPTSEKRGRQIKIRLIDITPSSLVEIMEKRMGYLREEEF